jgi:hypothetical protein
MKWMKGVGMLPDQVLSSMEKSISKVRRNKNHILKPIYRREFTFCLIVIASTIRLRQVNGSLILLWWLFIAIPKAWNISKCSNQGEL